MKKIFFIGKFGKLYDEEYIARSFEMLGHTVIRVGQHLSPYDMSMSLQKHQPDIILYCKWVIPDAVKPTVEKLKRSGTKTVCWLFDLYFGYPREYQVKTQPFFKSDYVFTTDGGHNEEFKNAGVNHHCVRQGIYEPECFMESAKKNVTIAFIGSENPLYPERLKIIEAVKESFTGFEWFGRSNTDELRGTDLNELYARTRIVLGDSVYSPNYWSNRVVETLGRGGFLIHPDVPGIKEEYPYLVTYKVGDTKDLISKIKYYLKHEDEREVLVKKNFEFVRDNYTMDKKCAELIKIVNG